MSRIQRWAEDVRQARGDARKAAELGTACERLAALRAVFEALGEAANRYADPHTAVRWMVSEAARAYTTARAQLLVSVA